MTEQGQVQLSGMSSAPPSYPLGDDSTPGEVRVEVREDSSSRAMHHTDENLFESGGFANNKGQQPAQGLPWERNEQGGANAGGPARTSSRVTLDVEDLEKRAAKGQQSLPAVLNQSGGIPPRLPKQASLPRPRSILKGATGPPPRKGSLDLSSSGVRRVGSLPSPAMGLTLQGGGEAGPPAGEGPPSISRLVHAASWDVGTQLPDAAEPPGGAPLPATPGGHDGGSKPQDESARSSLLGSAPLSGGAQRSLQRQVSFSPAVGGPAAEEAAIWPMNTLRRSLSRALSWGKDRMNSGWSSYSNVEFCRICHTVGVEEPIMDIGCDCRDGLNLAHQSCIAQWFASRGSNTCEICKSEASNIPAPPPLPPRNPPVRSSAAFVNQPPVPPSRTAVIGRVTQLLLWAAVGAMLLASILVVIVTRSNSRNARP